MRVHTACTNPGCGGFVVEEDTEPLKGCGLCGGGVIRWATEDGRTPGKVLAVWQQLKPRSGPAPARLVAKKGEAEEGH